MNIIQTLSDRVKHQFPDFYREEGQGFITFVEAYYEWMEREGGVLQQSNQIATINDIDFTPERFLENFHSMYMRGLPVELLGNQRLFQKHILELYRSKGSDAGLALLFRLLYNEEVTKYIPSYDIFAGSDGEWIEPQYLEVSWTSAIGTFIGRQIWGSMSGASAIVEDIRTQVVNGIKIIQILISNISGQFVKDESVAYTGLDPVLAPRIYGSVGNLAITATVADFKVGDILIDASPNRQKPLKAVVTSTYDATGIIEFELVDGGTYYSMDAEISITTGSNTAGTGASFAIGSLANTFIYEYSSDSLDDFDTVALNATSYGFPANPLANVSTIIDQALSLEDIVVGSIASIYSTNPGRLYNGDVNVAVIDPYTSGGGIGGDDAVITGKASFGLGLINGIEPLDSGFGYVNTSLVNLVAESDPSLTAQVIPTIVGSGIGEGYFNDTKGFLSEDKYLADGHYYQSFSYVIKSSRTLDRYVDILRRVYHPSGNAVYGEVLLSTVSDTVIIEEDSSVTSWT